ncbi:MAG TPA: hypothetical protein VFJ58_28030 [Armatimonadota bacterium]|nr:hypothetical protein [Armatimonadota bacterium]
MSDDQWLGAIAKYDDAIGGPSPTGGLVGGAFQLAQVLQNETKADPQRFAALLDRFPNGTHVAYLEAVMRGVTESSASPDLLVRVCERLHGVPLRPCGLEITRALRSMRDVYFPGEMLGILSWYATEDPDPLPPAPVSNGAGAQSSGLDLQTRGVNCVRGSAAAAIADLIFANPARGSSFLPLIGKMTRDPSAAVRVWVIESITALLNVDRDLAVRLFVNLASGSEEPLGTEIAVRFLAYAGRTHYEQLEPVLKSMMASVDPDVARAGARAACILSCTEQGAEHLAREVLDSGPEQRVAAVAVFVEAVWHAPRRAFAEEALARLFRDPDPEVRKQAADTFRHSDGHLAERPGLIQAFIVSAAFPEHPPDLLHYLLESAVVPPEIACRACEAALDGRPTLANPHVRGTREISRLLVRTYTQTVDPAIKRRCLDLIDRVIEIDVLDAVDALGSLDR